MLESWLHCFLFVVVFKRGREGQRKRERDLSFCANQDISNGDQAVQGHSG